MWMIVWTFIKNPKNIVITILVVAVLLLSIYATGQYIAIGVKDVKLERQDQALKTKDAMIDALGTANSQLQKSITQTNIQLANEKKLRIKAQQIKQSIEGAKTNEEFTTVHNDIVDLFNGVQSADSTK